MKKELQTKKNSIATNQDRRNQQQTRPGESRMKLKNVFTEDEVEEKATKLKFAEDQIKEKADQNERTDAKIAR